MNHFFFNCCSAIGRNFSTMDATAVLGMHLMRPFFHTSRNFPSSCACRIISNMRIEKNS